MQGFDRNGEHLIQAVQEQNYARVQELLEQGTDPHFESMFGHTPMQLALDSPESSDHKIAELLFEHGFDVNAKYSYSEYTILHWLLRLGKPVGKIQFLIQRGADVNATDNRGNSCLHAACGTNNLENIRLLIEHGTNVHAQNNDLETPFHNAVKVGDEQILQFLLENGANVNAADKFGNTPLHFRFDDDYDTDGQLNVAQLLIENGANVNAKAKRDGITPLHQAASNRHLDFVKVLIQNGAQVDPTDNEEKTPLHLACEKNYTEIAKFLIENGANVHAKDDLNQTPIHHACQNRHVAWGSLQLIHLLIENGCDLNEKSGDGWAPLHLVCMRTRHTAVVELLVNAGAKPGMESGEGSTPLQIAAELNRKEIAWFLVRRFPWLVLEE